MRILKSCRKAGAAGILAIAAGVSMTACETGGAREYDSEPGSSFEVHDDPETPNGGRADAVDADKPSRSKGTVAVEGQFELKVKQINKALDEASDHVEKIGGKVLEDERSGDAKHAVSGRLRVKVPAVKSAAFTAWMDKEFDVQFRRVRKEDIGRATADNKTAVANLAAVLEGLRKKVADPKLKTEDVLVIEREMRRVQGDLDKLAATGGQLAERVLFSVFDLAFAKTFDSHDRDPVPNFMVGARLTTLSISDPTPAATTRRGFGVSIGPREAVGFSLDVDLFDKQNDAARPLFVTLGGGAYSDYLGGGARHFFNPWLGIRAGYAYAAAKPEFLIGLETGVELLKYGHFVASVFGRGLSLLNKDGNLGATEAGLVVSAPF